MGNERVKLFDDWAETYDESVVDYTGFPFEGYERVLAAIVRRAEAERRMVVLDLGIGTGSLAERFVALGCSVWGLDFSAKMLAKARARLPRVELIKADVLGEWPLDPDRRFDRVVSGYVLHEFDLRSKVRLLGRLVEGHLADGGRIVVGDVSFPSRAARLGERERWRKDWDPEEHYWAADEAVDALREVGLAAEYEQVSFCGGVYVVRPAGAARRPE